MSKPPARSNPPTQRAITPELIRDALACIPPDVDRETWARLAMAIKSELSSGAGFDLWNEWSARGDTYNERSARDTWRSIKAGGATTVGTLFGIAKDHGFRFPDAVAPVQTPEQVEAAAVAAERLATERRRRQEAEAAEYRHRADKAARDAVVMWGSAGDAGQSPYLVRKGVQGHGVRYLADGTLLVPMREVAGELQNLQRIESERPADGGPEKRFLPGGRKSGLLHVIGQTEGAPVLLLAEGYATAASLHEATTLPVAVCFDAGNLVHVAKALRERWPALPLLVCGDDDTDTQARTGKNPGRDKAAAAARAAGLAQGLAAVVLPIGLPAGGSDFNDLASHAGTVAVAALVGVAVARLLQGAPAPAAVGEMLADGMQDDRTNGVQAAAPGVAAAPGGPALRLVEGGKGKPGKRARGKAASVGGDGEAGADGGGGGDDDGSGGKPRDPFSVDDHGVWFIGVDKDGDDKPRSWVCSRLVVTARTRADDQNGWGFLLEFSDPDGNPKTWAMPSAMLSGEGGEWAGRLRDMGLRMAPGTSARNLAARYIDTRRPDERVTCTDRVGWHGPVYVLPSGSIAPEVEAADDRRYVFQSDGAMEDTFRRHGELADWQSNVAALAVGNSRYVFAVACALAGPLVRPAGVESGGFHLRGISGDGKTTAQKVAASVWGRPTFKQGWRTTDNALEATAAQHCDCTLILDEMGQLDPRVAGDVAYMLANEQEKGRATRGAMMRKRRTWKLLFLSSGEVSLADHMAEAGKRTRAGMEVRMLDVPADAGCGMGVIEALHNYPDSRGLAEAVERNAARLYGQAGRAWLQWCCDHFTELPALLQDRIERYRADLVPKAAAEQVRRAGTRFALVAAAGELATLAGVTGWSEGEAMHAVQQCFNAWLGARGHMDNGEDAAMLRQVRQFLELNGEGRFAWWHRALDDHTPKTLNRAGFRRLLGEDGRPIKSDAEHQREYGDRMSAADAEAARVDFIVLREVFEREVCRGFDPRAVARLLQRRGHLMGEKASGETRLMDRQRLPGMGKDKMPCYHILPSIFADEL